MSCQPILFAARITFFLAEQGVSAVGYEKHTGKKTQNIYKKIGEKTSEIRKKKVYIFARMLYNYITTLRIFANTACERREIKC